MRSLTLHLSWLGLLTGCAPALLSATTLRACGSSEVAPTTAPIAVEPEQTLDVPPGLRPLPVVRAQLFERSDEGLVEQSEGLFLLTLNDGHLFLELLTSEWGGESGPWIAEQTTLRPGVHHLVSPEGSRAELHVTQVFPERPIPPSMQSPWHYVASALGSESLYDDPPAESPEPSWDGGREDAEWKKIEGGPDATRRQRILDALQRGSISGHSYGWSAEIRRALDRGDNALALALFRYYRPIGRCSMDQTPNHVASAYAALCKKLGKTGCFLQLHLRIMGNQFARVTSASYAERVHATESNAFADVGIDADRFLLGLVVRGQGIERKGEISAFRLGRGIFDAGRGTALLPVVRRWAESPEVDEYNRLRAALVAESIAFHLEGRESPPRLDLALGEVAREVIEARDRE